MDFGRQKWFLLDVEEPRLRRWAVLLDGAKGSHNHRDCCCFDPPQSLNLDFQVFVFVKLFRGSDWGFGVEGYISHVNEKEGFVFLFFSTMSGLLAAMVLSVRMDTSHRMVTLSFLVTALGSCSYNHLFASIPNSLQIFQCAAALLWRLTYSVYVSLSKKVFLGPKVVVNRFGWNLAQTLGVMRYFNSHFGSLLWLLVLELRGGGGGGQRKGLIFAQPSKRNFESTIRPHWWIVLPNKFDHELYHNRAFSSCMTLCP